MNPEVSDLSDRALDGNAAAGLLGEIFPFDMTMVWTMCSGCASMDRVGAHRAYMDAPGVVIRCVHCDTVLIRAVHGGGRYWLDLRGAVCLQIDEQV
jgi:hypothetical protein